MKLKDLIQEENKSVYKQENFIRFGGLSATPHEIHYKQRKDYFHTPPAKSGIFCFLNDYVEPSLYNWKIRGHGSEKTKESHLKKREFKYRGKIWTHIKSNDPNITYYRQKGTWYETDTSFIREILSNSDQSNKNLHYEVFIEKQNLGGI